MASIVVSDIGRAAAATARMKNACLAVHPFHLLRLCLGAFLTADTAGNAIGQAVAVSAKTKLAWAVMRRKPLKVLMLTAIAFLTGRIVVIVIGRVAAATARMQSVCLVGRQLHQLHLLRQHLGVVLPASIVVTAIGQAVAAIARTRLALVAL